MKPLVRRPRRRPTLVGAAVALGLALTLAACGDDTEDADGSGVTTPDAVSGGSEAASVAPETPSDDDGEVEPDAATAEFCEEFEEFTEDLNDVGEADDDGDAAEAANDAASELSDIPLPQRFSEEARDGLMAYADFLDQVTAADVADLRNLQDLGQVFDEDLPQVQAFIVETGEACFAPTTP